VIAIRVEAAHPLDVDDREAFVHTLSDEGADVPYVMFVDQENTRLYEQKHGKLAGPTVESPTHAILSLYDSSFGSGPVYQPYMEVLVESWIRDLLLHWKSPDPPLSQEMGALFSSRLTPGFTASASSSDASSSSSTSSSSSSSNGGW
ncbi:MAG TPA: hypothetical protein VLI90_01520, partial [Tepidisphaeraceae bacterium]|nr:hypothetical protein [Tepidisphaeraceae bacterium]